MALTLSNLLQGAYQRLGQMRFSLATGGSTSTLVDSTLIDGASDGQFTGGTLIVVRDAAGASAAPEGEFCRVTSFTASSGTFGGSFTVAPASGDRYGYTNDLFPLQQMIALANDTLIEIGDVPLIDTSITTASGQTEYTVPVAVKRQPPFRVQIQTLSDSNDNRWEDVKDWDFVPAAAGSTGLLIFKEQPVTGMTVKVWYMGVHPALNAYGDVVNETIAPDLAIKALLLKATEWRVSTQRGLDDFMKEQYNKAAREYDAERIVNPPFRPRRKPKLLVISEYEDDDNDDERYHNPRYGAYTST